MTQHGHPAMQLDDVVHQRARLGVLAILHEVKEADFNTLRSTLELTPGNLSRHLVVLEEARLVTLRKTIDRKKTRTWVALTHAGAMAYLNEVQQLRALVQRFDEVDPDD